MECLGGLSSKWLQECKHRQDVPSPGNIVERIQVVWSEIYDSVILVRSLRAGDGSK